MGYVVGPSIINSGLVLALDAGDRLSYSGNGQGTTTWYDLSGNNKHFTVSIEVGQTAWNSAGYFELNDSRTFTRASTITTSTTCTMVFWLRTNDQTALLMKGQTTTQYLGAYGPVSNFYNNDCGTPTYTVDLQSVANPNNVNTLYTDNIWHMWEAKSVNLSTWTGYGFNDYGSGFTFSAGAIAAIYIYNRNLTTQESAQNYNAMKKRFAR